MSSEKRSISPKAFESDVPPLKSSLGRNSNAKRWCSVQQTQKSFSATNAFRTAASEGERDRIGQELASTLQSSDALERFYAVNAMARVEAAYFKGALRSASRDADRHVSDLARRALEKLSRG